VAPLVRLSHSPSAGAAATGDRPPARRGTHRFGGLKPPEARWTRTFARKAFPVNLTSRDAVWTPLLYKAGSGKVAQVLAMYVVWAFTFRLAGLPVPAKMPAFTCNAARSQGKPLIADPSTGGSRTVARVRNLHILADKESVCGSLRVAGKYGSLRRAA